MFRKILIMFFISVSGFLVVSCFYRKANNKEPLTMYSVFYEFENAKIGYDIELDVKELASSMNEVNKNFSSSGSDVFSKVSSIAKMLYYMGRFVIKLVFHVLTACLNIVILALRIIGFDNLSYIRLSSPSTDSWYNIPGDIKPPNWN